MAAQITGGKVGRKQRWKGCLLLLLLLVGIPALLIWRELRQERLSAQLLAVLKEEPPLPAIDYSTQNDPNRPDRVWTRPQILQEEATAVRLLQAGADPDLRDVVFVRPSSWEEIKDLLKRMFQRPADSSDLPTSALAMAVQNNDAVIVTALLKAGAHDVNAQIKVSSDNSRNIPEYPLVNYAAYVGNLEIVKELCAYRADIHKLNSEGASILQSVLEGVSDDTPSEDESTSKQQQRERLVALDRKRRAEMFHLLQAKGAKYEANSKIGYALLSAAVAGGFRDLARELLAAGAPPTAKPGWITDPLEESPLDLAVAKGDVTLVNLLFQYGASTGDAILDARTPEMAQLLVDHGANIHAVSTHWKTEGENALSFACKSGDTKMALFLMEHGLSPNSGGDYNSSIDEAAEYGGYEMVRVLLEHGAKVGPHSPGSAALWLAIAESHFDSAKLILRYGGAMDTKEHNALTEAISQESASMALALLKHGANVNADGGAALFAACDSCDEDLVEILLEHGADPTLRTEDGTTAIQAAKQNADPPSEADGIIALLKDYGAKQ